MTESKKTEEKGKDRFKKKKKGENGGNVYGCQRSILGSQRRAGKKKTKNQWQIALISQKERNEYQSPVKKKKNDISSCGVLVLGDHTYRPQSCSRLHQHAYLLRPSHQFFLPAIQASRRTRQK